MTHSEVWTHPGYQGILSHNEVPGASGPGAAGSTTHHICNEDYMMATDWHLTTTRMLPLRTQLISEIHLLYLWHYVDKYKSMHIFCDKELVRIFIFYTIIFGKKYMATFSPTDKFETLRGKIGTIFNNI